MVDKIHFGGAELYKRRSDVGDLVDSSTPSSTHRLPKLKQRANRRRPMSKSDATSNSHGFETAWARFLLGYGS